MICADLPQPPDPVKGCPLNPDPDRWSDRLTDLKKTRSAYIVNVHDAINFDIDFGLSRPSNLVKYNSYTYYQVPVSFYKTLDFNDIYRNILTGQTCRCRLFGITIRKDRLIRDTFQYRVNLDVKKLIDRSDGVIFVKTHNVDIYNRILVDISIPLPDQVISLTEYLLETYPQIYSRYVSRTYQEKKEE